VTKRWDEALVGPADSCAAVSQHRFVPGNARSPPISPRSPLWQHGEREKERERERERERDRKREKKRKRKRKRERIEARGRNEGREVSSNRDVISLGDRANVPTPGTSSARTRNNLRAAKMVDDTPEG